MGDLMPTEANALMKLAYDTDLSRSRFRFARLEDGWVQVTGGQVPEGLSVRPAYWRGKLHLFGVRVDAPHPVTSTSLRRIPLPDIAASLLIYLQVSIASAAMEEFEVWEGMHDQQLREAEREQMRVDYPEVKRAHDDLIGLAEAIERLGEAASAWTPRGRGATPPSADDYRNFARLYLEELLRGRGAVARTAKRASMNRSTVYRWIEECRARGLLPAKEAE